jgi:membrane protein implicated in regulation of membrane protease activity
MSLSFDNDGPTVHIKKINLKEFEIEKSKFSGKAFFPGGVLIILIALIVLCLLILSSETNILSWVIACPILGIIVCTFLFQWEQDKKEKQLSKNRKDWSEDQKAIQQLVGHEFVLSPTTSSSNGRLRIFYRDSSDMLCVWYSKGIYRFQKTIGEGSVDFSRGLVLVPNFVQIQEKIEANNCGVSL